MKNLITIPRITGILLLAIAWFAARTQTKLHVALLAISGAVLLLTPTGPALKRWQEFRDSFRLTKSFAIIMLLDILFLAVLAVLTLILSNVLRGTMELLKQVDLSDRGVLLAKVDMYNDIIGSFFSASITAIIIFWIAVVIAYSLSRGMIWLTLLDKPLQKKFFVRSGLFNLAWCTVWITLMLFILASQSPMIGAVAFIVLMLVYTHLTTILHHSYAKHNTMSRAVGEAFGIGLGRLGSFLNPLAYIFIIYVILSQVLRVVTGNAALVVTFAVYLAFMAWYRTYMRDVLRQVQ